MKNKIIGWLSYTIDILFTLIGVAFAVAFVLAFHFGVPYLFYWIVNGELSYSTILAIWFGVYFVRNVFKVISLKKKLKQYKEIDDIMKGRF
ncbi:hypothetical protein CKQ70_30710 [Bacillus toyonensis]|nr:hypothetical protein CKQ70_30710 [Bacillus toyonensis]PAW43681.1 hypothetical protein CKQ69_30740 [Bacillus toyonensis]